MKEDIYSILANPLSGVVDGIIKTNPGGSKV